MPLHTPRRSEASRCDSLGKEVMYFFARDYDGMVLKVALKGIQLLKESPHYAWIKAMSGVLWHDVVCFCAKKQWWGIENLSHIPGSVGGAVRQNIGAYGQVLETSLISVEAFHMHSQQRRTFSLTACELAYRNSFFRQNPAYFIESLTLRLKKKSEPNTTYRGIQAQMEKIKTPHPTPADMVEIIGALRSKKLPLPAKIGNAGSFFHNPIVSAARYRELQTDFAQLQGFAQPSQDIKMSAGQLIELCGWKGHTRGPIGVYADHALVLIHKGGGKVADFITLIADIKQSVQKRFGITLTHEVETI